MRNVRALFGLAVVAAAAVGCGGGEQTTKGAQAPQQTGEATPPPETTPPPSAESEMPPQQGGMQQPGMQQPGMPQQGGMQQGQPGAQGAQNPAMMQMSSNDLAVGTITCMLGPTMHESSMGMGGMHGGGPSDTMGSPQGGSSPGGSSQGGTGSSGQGSMGQGSSGQGSSGQGSMGQGSMGQGQGSMSWTERCGAVAQAANVMPTSVVNGDTTALETVHRVLETRLSAEGASTDATNVTLAFFDKGVAAAKEARTAFDALHAQSAMGGGPTSTGTASGRTRSGAYGQGSATGQESSRSGAPTVVSTRASEDIRAHRALGDLYQFGRNQGPTQIGTEAQTLAWIIGADRFMDVNQLAQMQKSFAAEPLFAAILNVPAPTATGGRPPTYNEYLAAAARSLGGTSSRSGTSGRAVGGGPSGTDEKGNTKEVMKVVEERLDVLAQQLPASSELRSDADATLARVRSFQPQPTTPSKGSSGQQKGGTNKKPPSGGSQQQKQQQQK